ncbi:pyridoxal phosphate-dependent aminotransferase [Flavobacteriaceae bacterium]|jgi:aspartate aminotransferase|nr:pyridoxal phosphate-dependent aminotransferase [Cryomorphaceae bacterium]MDB3967661.1 pyridoxal phosphate-dependent aminotransferase [Flavobacteriaceae bacterium]MBT3503868.1 pyridoxal phosphate-dependent aminotransferase [Cryomorphaceae bacterium]MBT3689094.1 pyridoxal phosphate-dependent aminotransferase [Cryomorphaceae bacterium]MBT4222636.1 pyridoxal phosphate-dependent aminotransferase [Cryomorphaceae bacterium]
MPTISKKGNNIPPSPIRKLVPFADQAKKKGVDILHLNIGQPDIKSPTESIDAIKNIELDILKYEYSQGSYEFRNNLCKYYSNHNIHVLPDDIITTVGASEALSFTLNSICDPGDEVIIPEPFYANYNGFAQASDVKVIPITSKIEDNFSLPSIESFENKINNRTKAIIICNPCNPTGYVYSKDEIIAIADLAKKHDLFIVVDEVYREFIYTDIKHFSILEDQRFYENAILIDSTSKRYSLCGARIGFIVSKNSDFIETCLKFALTRLSPPTLALIAANEALNSDENYIKNVINEYSNRRKVLISELSNLNDIQYSNPMGAFYSIIKLPVNNAEEFAKFLLTDFSINNESVMVSPASGFYSSKNIGNDEIRIAFVLNSEKLKRAIKIINLGLKEFIS